MGVCLSGKMEFEPNKKTFEGDLEIKDIHVWVEKFLVDSFNMYDSSEGTIIHFFEKNRRFVEFRYRSYFNLGNEDETPQEAEDRVMEVYDFNTKKKVTYKMVKVEEGDLTYGDLANCELPSDLELKCATLEYNENANNLPEEKNDILIPMNGYLSSQTFGGSESLLDENISKWEEENGLGKKLIRAEVHYYTESILISLYYVNA